MKKKHIERFLEFLLIGVLLGTVEDVIAVKLSTGADIHPETILIIILVAIPFAAFSELVVDSGKNNLIRKTAERIHRKIPG